MAETKTAEAWLASAVLKLSANGFGFVMLSGVSRNLSRSVREP
jgi:hypothetical protein